MLAKEQYVWWTIEENYMRIPLAFAFNERRRRLRRVMPTCLYMCAPLSRSTR
jgi:hypothetical protein